MLVVKTYMSFFPQKKTKKFYDARLIFGHLQHFLVKLFLDQVPNKSFFVLNPCQSWKKMQEFTLKSS